jgi:SAM-dependent methyltransferase
MKGTVPAATRAQAFFDDLWARGDYWQLETSPFERAKYAREIEMLGDRRYGRVLEVGCGAGAFTRMLAAVSDQILAVDVSPVAIERARRAPATAGVEFRVMNIMSAGLDAAAYDLVVMSETVYYLGWLYSFFDVAWLAERLFDTVRGDGRLLMANTFGESLGYLLRPSVIRTYRDLAVNAGFAIEREEIFRGAKDGVDIDVLISLFGRTIDR